MDAIIWFFLGAAAIGWICGWFVLSGLRRVPKSDADPEIRLSIVIPARNEEFNLQQLFQGLATQDWRPHEVIVVDDCSEDSTAAVARNGGARVIAGSEPPEGWKGKSWACSQGAAAATGDWLLFLDADTYFDPGGLRRIANLSKNDSAVHSVCPFHEVVLPYEQFSAFFNVIMAGGTTASGLFGQTLLVSRAHYDAIGGHEPVKDKVLENLHLARHFNEAGIPCRSHRGRGVISMRMFPGGFKALCNGWSKGFVSGAASTPRKALILISAWLSGLITSLVAMSFLPVASQVAQIGITALYVAFVFQCLLLFRKIGSFIWPAALLFPIPLCFYLGLFFNAAMRARKGGSIQWKGRDVG